MSTPRPFHVKQIDHVTIVVKDLARSRWFYREMLGMNEVSRPAFSFQGQWFQAGSTLIHTILEFEGSGPAGQSGGKSSRRHHIAFTVPDVRIAEKFLQQEGVPIVVPCKLRPDGALQTFLHDPDGHLIELTSPPERVLSPLASLAIDVSSMTMLDGIFSLLT
ncbi:VOC family protein [Planctopirus hydrillae]|uniref:Glyoxalase n=1 Tax=Planctopirus hydrillae TaxID=1841610 RepID=A0A1C3ENB8_9PLAN|nr:VOC family protein [Planctopirus hydrillae]ODA34722.1 glyoxalase [Planctopirus hydrillae]